MSNIKGFQEIPGSELPNINQTVMLISKSGREYEGSLIEGSSKNEGAYFVEHLNSSSFEERVGEETPVGWKMVCEVITAHQLAKILLEGPDDPVIVNGGDHIEETKPLTKDDIKADSKENGGTTGGPFEASAWITLGTL